MKLTFRAIQEQILDSITEQGTVIYTNEKNMYIVKSDGTKMKVSDNIFVEDETIMNDLPQKYIDKIYITKNNWRMYTWDGSVFKLLSGGGGSGGTGGISETQRETITVTDGLTSIKVPFSFPIGGNLKVYKNGVLLDLDKDYTESTNAISLTVPTVSTDLFTFMLELAGVVKLEPTSYQLTLEYNLDGTVAKEIYTGGVEKTITYEYDTEGNVTKQFVLRDGQTFTTTYNYDAQGNITTVVDEGSQIAVLTSGDGILQGIKPISHTLTLVYNPDGSVGQEVYTGDIQKTITYFYTSDGNIDYKEVLESDGSVRKATYNYIDGKLISIIDEGTDLVIVEGSGSQTAQTTTKPVTQDDIAGKLVGSTTLTDDIAFLVNTINDLIANQELLEAEIEALKQENNGTTGI
jgi:YD repeat-containing protein